MPVYKIKIRGTDQVRAVRASSMAKCREHIVEAEAITAEELADLLADGVVLEKVDETAPSSAPEIVEGPGDEPVKPERAARKDPV